MTQPDLPDFQTRVTDVLDNTLFTGTLNFGGVTGFIDVSQYSSLVISNDGNLHTLAGRVAVQWADAAGVIVGIESVTWPADVAGVAPPDFTVPVRYPKAQLVNQLGAPVGVTLYGSIRNVRGLQSGIPAPTLFVTDGGTAKTVGSLTDFGYLPGGGRYFFSWISSGTTVKGSMTIAFVDNLGNLQNMRIADTTDAHVIGTGTEWHGEIIIPNVLCKLQFLCTVAGTNQLFAYLAAAGQ